MRSSVASMGKDLKTRYQGVYVRHQRSCPALEGKRCACRPGYMARVWDRARQRQVRSPTLHNIEAAKNWRTDTIAKLDRGELPDVRVDLRLGKAIDTFLEAAREGKVLTKHGRRYKARAIGDLDSALNVHVKPTALAAKRLGDVRRGEVQLLVDDLATVLSGSRVRTVVNALRSLYRWAQDRDLVSHDPAQHVRLPAMDAKPRDRVATPAELEQLLAPLKPEDALPYALAAYATARLQEARRVTWDDVDLDLGVIYLGTDPDGRKTRAAQRAVPMVRSLRARVRAEWMRQGQPAEGLVCPPRGANNRSGLLSVQGVHEQALQSWGWERVTGAGWVKARPDAATPIGMQECRHTAASWLNAAGVNPKVASILMGHSTPERAAAAAAGAAGLTLARYTHALPGDLERARDQLDAYLVRAMGDAESAAR